MFLDFRPTLPPKAMKSSLVLLLGGALLALSAPHRNGTLVVTTVTIEETTTICPEPTPPPQTCASDGDGDGDGGATDSSFTAKTDSSATRTGTSQSPAGTNLALKRDWDLDASDMSQLDLKKSCRMLYAKEEVPLGSSESNTSLD